MSAPSHLDWCDDVYCGDPSHRLAREREHVTMAVLGNASQVIDAPKRPKPHGWDIARLERIEAILRANRMHEGSCAVWQFLRMVEKPQCDCWLAEGPA